MSYEWGEGRDEPEAFYANSYPCESCGKPCDELHRPYWPPELKVGICCALHSDEWPEYSQPTCHALFRLVSTCRSVAEVSAVMESHSASGCLLCSPKQEIGKDGRKEKERKAA